MLVSINELQPVRLGARGNEEIRKMDARRGCGAQGNGCLSDGSVNWQRRTQRVAVEANNLRCVGFGVIGAGEEKLEFDPGNDADSRADVSRR